MALYVVDAVCPYGPCDDPFVTLSVTPTWAGCYTPGRRLRGIVLAYCVCHKDLSRYSTEVDSNASGAYFDSFLQHSATFERINATCAGVNVRDLSNM